MRSQGNTNAVEHIVPALDRIRRNRHAGVIIGRMHDAKRIGLRLPAIGIERARIRLAMIALAVCEDFVDRHGLAQFRLGQHLVVMITPPGRDAGAEHLPLEVRISAGPRYDVENANLQHVAGLRIPHRDRPGADVNTETFAGAAAVDRRIHRPCPAPIDILGLARPVKHAFSAGVAGDHPRRIVRRMLRQSFDRDGIA